MTIWKRAAMGIGLVVSLLTLATPALAQRLSEQGQFSASIGSGARALGMGGAFIAIADDATAASWNPAGLAVLEKPEASVVMIPRSSVKTDFAPFVFNFSSGTYRDRESYDGYRFKQSGQALEFASFTYPFRVGSAKVVPQVSYQRAVDLGLDSTVESYRLADGADSDLTFSRTFNGSGSLSGDFSGGVDIYSGSLGLSFTQKVFLGVSLNLWRNGSEGSGVSAFRYTTTGGTNPFSIDRHRETTVDENFRGFNVNVGAMFRPTNRIRLGAVYKSSFTMKHDLQRSVNQTGTSTEDGALFPFTRTYTEAGDIKWPYTIALGVAFLPTDLLTLSADWTTTNWSDAKYDFAALTTTTNVQGTTSRSTSGQVLWPTFSDPARPEAAVVNPGQVDTMQLRFGAEYVIRKPGFGGLSVLPVRAGVFTDRQYFRDTPEPADVNLLGLTGGIGLVWSHLTVDFAYVHQSASYRSSDYTSSDAVHTESQQGQGEDKSKSNKFYISAIVRF